ncbi:MAG: hypothetical protein II229_03550 [Clostridia bacterium]|nr:hypothetical protein [Clostridia bacterium]
MTGITGMIPYFFTFVALAAVFFFLPRTQRTKRAAVALLVLSFVAELFVANFHSFHLLGGGYETVDLPITGEGVAVSGGTLDGESVSGSTVTLTWTDLGKKAGTVAFRVNFEPAPTEDGKEPKICNYVDVRVDAKDVTNAASWRSGVADGQILRDDARSSYVVLDLSGNVNELRVKLTAQKDTTFTLEGVRLNETVPLHFSALRLLLVVLGGMAVFGLCTAPSMKRSFGEDPRPMRRIALGMTVVLVLGAVAITFASMYDQNGIYSTGFANKSGNQITQEIVDAFLNGQVHLMAEPPEELLNLENPYDWSARSGLKGVHILWDHLLYNGQYYSYYGIAPVLLLFLPYTALTGYYFPTSEAVLLFSVVGIIFLTLLFLEFCKRFANRIPTGMLAATLLILQLSSGAWFNLVYDNFYEIAQASGFMFTCMGFFFLLRSGVVGEGRVRRRHIALAAACLSFAVLCRPTLALYCVAACVFFGFGFVKYRDQLRGNKRLKVSAERQRRKTVGYILAAILPFALIGGIQVIYNIARFGNPLDFGIQYSLTINDFTRSQYHTDFVMIGLYNFLWTFPVMTTEFPFVASNFSTLSVNGYYFVANRHAIGILWRGLPSLGYLGAVPAWKCMTKKERIQALCLLIPTCVVIPLIIIFSIWESGYGVRYCCDFAWQIILGGAAVLYLLWARVADGQGKTILRHAFTVAAVVAVVLNGALIYGYLTRTGHLELSYLRFERLFEFWL